MIHTLKCPSCAAPLDYDDKAESRTFRCPFCNNMVYLPDSPRRAGPQVPVSTFGEGSRRGAKVGPAIMLAVVVVLAVVGGIIYAVTRAISGATRTAVRTQPDPPPRPAFAPPTKPTDARPAPPAFASTVLKFGGEGIGPGSFSDARSIAVDGEGHIYVGDYTGGRIQVFDPSGKFITQWMADAKMPLRGMAADRRGTIYVVQRGKILRYEGASGKLLGEVAYPGGWGFDDVAVTADGGLVAFWSRNRDDIVRFDSSGKVSKVIRAAVSGQTDRSELDIRVAVDGLGNIYALGTFNNAVFKFTPEGRFVNQFGGEGDQTGQFRAPQSIAVDNKGRVYVSDFKGIQVFDANGRYLDIFKPAPIAFGLVFNDQNELFIAARTQALKCVLNKQ